MTEKINNHFGRAGILNLISQREQGTLFDQLYRTSVTNVKVNQLPKFPQDPTELFIDGYNWHHVRNSTRGDLIGVGWNDLERHSSVCMFHFMSRKTLNKNDNSIDTDPFIKEISRNYKNLHDFTITDTADLSYLNQKPLLIVGECERRRNTAIMTFYPCDDDVHQEYEWGVGPDISCCASQINSVNFVLGTRDGFFICRDLRLSNIYQLENVVSTEFNDDGNILFISGNKRGILCYDMRENLVNCFGNPIPYIRTQVLKNPLIAYQMKLMRDQVSLIVSDKIGCASKIDLRMRKPVFQFLEHPSGALKPKIQFEENDPGALRPLSIDEDLDLLCGIGTGNNYCRIWSLSSGKLQWVQEIQHPRFKRHACIVSSERRWFVAIVQDSTVTTLVPDEPEMVAFPSGQGRRYPPSILVSLHLDGV